MWTSGRHGAAPARLLSLFWKSWRKSTRVSSFLRKSMRMKIRRYPPSLACAGFPASRQSITEKPSMNFPAPYLNPLSASFLLKSFPVKVRLNARRQWLSTKAATGRLRWRCWIAAQPSRCTEDPCSPSGHRRHPAVDPRPPACCCLRTTTDGRRESTSRRVA